MYPQARLARNIFTVTNQQFFSLQFQGGVLVLLTYRMAECNLEIQAEMGRRKSDREDWYPLFLVRRLWINWNQTWAEL